LPRLQRAHPSVFLDKRCKYTTIGITKNICIFKLSLNFDDMRCQLIVLIISISFSLTIPLSAKNQTLTPLDSLKAALSQASSAEVKSDLYNSLFIETIKFSPDEAKNYAQLQINLAGKESLNKGLAQGLNNLSVYYNSQGKLDSASYFIEQTILAYQKTKDLSGLGGAYLNLGNLNRQSGDFPAAISAYKKASSYFSQAGETSKYASAINGIGNAKRNLGELDSALFFYKTALDVTDTATLQAIAFMNIGNVLAQKGEYEEAVVYHLKSVKIKEELNDRRGLMSSYINMGVIYSRLEQFDKSEASYHKAIRESEAMGIKQSTAMAYNNIGTNKARQKDFDSAAFYFKKSLDIRKALGNRMEIGMSENNLGNVYRDLGNLDSALHYHELALQSKLEANDKYGIPSAYYNTGSILSLLGRAEAEEYILKGYNMAKDVSPVLEEEAAKTLFEHYQSRKNYKAALDIQTRLIALKDTLRSEETKKRIEELEKKYESEKKDNEIALLAKDNELQAQKIAQTETERIIYIISFIFIIGWGVGFFYLQRKKHQADLFLAEREKLVFDQKIKQLLKESEITRIESLLKGQEEERKRMARELHDGLGGMLAALKISLQSEAKGSSANNRAVMLAEKSADEVRKISHNLMAGALQKYGLVEALRDLSRQVEESTNLKLNFYCDRDEYTLNPEAETHLFRMLQEIISNCLKHAKASELSIQIHQEADTLHITTEDDGVGFDPGQMANGIGTDNIRDRAEALHAKLTVESSKGRGCTYFIEVPIVINQLT
jgi:two-component system, NarL family, sensor kinase